MKKRSQIALTLSLVLIIGATGYLREFLFVNINEQIRYLWYNNELSYMSRALSFLDDWSLDALVNLKWVLTLLFSGIYFLESALMMKFIFREYNWKTLTFTYVLLIGAAGALYVGFWVFGSKDEGYTLSRYLMGLAQSPVPLMLLIPALYLRKLPSRQS